MKPCFVRRRAGTANGGCSWGLLALALSLAPAGSWAQPPAGEPKTGQELAAALRAAVPLESAEYRAHLQIRPRDGALVSVPVTCRIEAGEPTWRVTYETRAVGTLPAERLVIVHSTNAPNQYFFARAARPGEPPGEPRRLSAEELTQPLAGSDFWLLDLGLDFFHWPTQRLLKTEMRKGRVCYVLESRHPQPPADGYSRVVAWLDKETGGPILAEAYGRDGRLLKEFSIRSFKKVEGRWHLEEMEIRDARKRSRTRLEFDFAPEPGR